ncbi:hypothetical protein [Stutzerimonas kunmingensis]|uniref:hypothetical protein n=1 Tax=Stutzerimonas kunmingensis TaxID=1211807 RepID=UPI00241ED1F5|nr:hypothetical protein [Stutzerimonas kunmingensis]
MHPRNKALLAASLLFPIFMMLPVLLWPHYGLFSDAEQLIEYPKRFLAAFPESMKLLAPLEDGRWNPAFHGLSIVIYALVPDSARAFYVMQTVLLSVIVGSLFFISYRYTRSPILAALSVVLFCSSSSFFESFYTLDKVEPRVTAFFALISCLFLSVFHFKRERELLRACFLVLQFLLGAMLLFSKETGLFLAAALFATWCCATLFWPKDEFRGYLLKASLVQLFVVVVYFSLFKWLAPPMSYRYVSYSVSPQLILNNAVYYFKSSPELFLGLLSACYWACRALMPRLPGPDGGFRVALTFLSFSLLAYVAGILIWRWPLDYYLLPAHFIVAALLPMTGWWIGAPIFRNGKVKKITFAAAAMAWGLYFAYRLLLGGSVFVFDALKDDLALYLSQPEFLQKRIVLPFNSPQSYEIGERLRFFINAERDTGGAVSMYNFWEPPVVDKKNLARFSMSAAVIPSQKKLSQLLADPEHHNKTSIWQYDLYQTEGEIWRYDQIDVGDLVLVPTGSVWYSRLQTRGLNMHSQSPASFMRQSPVALRHLGGVRRDVGPLWLGWDVFEIQSSTLPAIVSGYDLYLLRSLNEYQQDITDKKARHDLFNASVISAAALLGQGWYAVEAQGDEVFRWMGKRADILVNQAGSGVCYVYLDVEPLIAGQVPLSLRIALDSATASYDLTGRQRIRFDYKSSGSSPKLMTLLADGGVEHVPGDTRTLKLRAFSVSSPSCESVQ